MKNKVGIHFILMISFVLFAYSQNTPQWIAHLSGSNKNGNNSGTATTVDRSGNLLVTGWVTNTGTGIDMVTIKYASDGEELKRAYYAGPSSSVDKGIAIAVDTGKSVYVTGTTGSSASKFDYITIKYDSNLQQIWAKPYNGSGDGEDQPVAVAVNDSLNVFVSGWSRGSGTNFDYATIKYNSLGEEKWVRRYNGPKNGSDSALGMVLYRNTDLFVTGTSVDSGYDYFTIKYNPVTGDSLWSARYNGFGMGNDIARGIVRNTNGEIFITGGSQNQSGNYDYLTLAYGTAGDLQWVNRYNGPVNSDDQAYAIGFFGTSRVYVTGKSIQMGTFNDIVTMSINQNNGSDNWVKSYDGPANDEDVGTAISGANNPFIMGQSTGSGIGKDYVFLQYNGNNGNLNIESRYNGYANSDDVPAAFYSSGGAIYITGSSKKLKGSELLTIKYVDNDVVKYRSFVQDSLAKKSVNLKSALKPTEGNVCESAMLLAYPKIKKGYAGYPGGLVAGSPNPDSASSYGWMRFDKGKSVSAYLIDTGAVRWFDIYGKLPFVGEKKNPKRTSHNNHLAAELITLKINIGASDAGVTPPTFGDIRYDNGDPLNPYRNKTLRQIAATADNYMTYGRQYTTVDWKLLDSVLMQINRAFVETLKIVCKDPLVVTGVKPIDSVSFLKPAILPLIQPLAFERGSIELSPEKFELYQNYPNPFNPSTTISFDLTDASLVTLKVYDIVGREVATLVEDAEFDAGAQEVLFDASASGGLASGVYFYRIIVNQGERQMVKKMMLMK